MALYTGTGDHGETGLFGNTRVHKADLRIAAYGTVDELNCALGLVRAEPLPPSLDASLGEIQGTLFDLGADLATPASAVSLPRVRAGTARLEEWIDASEADLPPLRTFILPGGHREGALFHLARAVARRAERLFWALSERDAEIAAVPADLGIYLNRLSDLLFTWARAANARHGAADQPWSRPQSTEKE